MVNYKRAILFLSVVVFAVLGCDPTELPEPSDGEPVFSLQGNLGSTAFELAAGVDAYFMYTALSPANNGRFRSLSRLEELDCTTDCAPGWQFEFYGSAAVLDSLLAPGQLPFLQPATITADTIYNLNLTAGAMHSGNGGAAEHLWTFFDGSTGSTADIQKNLPGPGTYEVELQTFMDDGCTSYTKKTFSTLEALPDCEVNFWVDSTIAFDSLILAYYLPGPLEPVSLLWQDSIEGDVVSLFFPQGAGMFDLCLEGVFEQGCSAVSCQTIMMAQPSFPGAVCSNSITGGIDVEIGSVVVPGPTSGVVVRYVDESGNSYSTEHGEQVGAYQFVIDSAVPFERNSLGQPTLQLDIRFQCQLYDTQGQPWKQAQGMGTIAVAIPE